MTLRPDLCLVKLAPPAETAPSGLILAHALTPAVCYGKVVQVGSKVRDVAAGSFIAFPPTAGEPMEGMFPTPHLLIPEREISAVIEAA